MIDRPRKLNPHLPRHLLPPYPSCIGILNDPFFAFLDELGRVGGHNSLFVNGANEMADERWALPPTPALVRAQRVIGFTALELPSACHAFDDINHPRAAER